MRIPFQGITFPFAVPWHLFCDNTGTAQVNECQSFSPVVTKENMKSLLLQVTNFLHSTESMKLDTQEGDPFIVPSMMSDQEKTTRKMSCLGGNKQ